MGVLRLGLLSTAHVNERILAGAAASERVDVVAVASRAPERAAAFAQRYGLPRAHGSYGALLADPGVDAIYVSTPNGLHVEHAVAALRAGKHVLVEKPLTPVRAEAERCFDEAERAGRVLTEGFMWRHLPQTRRLRERLAAGDVGEVRLVHASHAFALADFDDPRWDPALAGGALLDVGCYCVSALRLVAGEPLAVAAHAVPAPSGVDRRLVATLRCPDGVLGLLDCALDLPRRRRLEVVGADGALVLPDAFHGRVPRLELTRPDGTLEVEDLPADDPFRLELEDFAEAIATGRPPLLGRDDAVGQATVLEALLAAAASSS